MDAQGLLRAELNAGRLIAIRAKVAYQRGLGAPVKDDDPKRAGLYAPTTTGTANLVQRNSVGSFIQAQGIPGTRLQTWSVAANLAGGDDHVQS